MTDWIYVSFGLTDWGLSIEYRDEFCLTDWVWRLNIEMSFVVKDLVRIDLLNNGFLKLGESAYLHISDVCLKPLYCLREDDSFVTVWLLCTILVLVAFSYQRTHNSNNLPRLFKRSPRQNKHVKNSFGSIIIFLSFLSGEWHLSARIVFFFFCLFNREWPKYWMVVGVFCFKDSETPSTINFFAGFHLFSFIC